MYKTLCTMAVTACLAGPAAAGNWSIAVPDALPKGGQTIKDEGWRLFLRTMGPGDRYAVLNATTPGQVAVIDVPPDPKLKNPKRRAKLFARENRKIAQELYQVSEGTPEVNVIGVLRHVALTRIDPNRPLDLMIVGSAVQKFAEWPDLSMDQKGAIYVPSPDHVTAPVLESAYGMGAEGPNGLANVYLHLCPVADDLRSDEEAALQGFYGAYAAARSGTLVTWSTDLSTCFERFKARVRTPINAPAYTEAKGTPLMVKVGPTEVVVKTEPTTVIVNGMKVKQFNIFASAAHPALPGVEVTTGVVYEPGQYPDKYKNAYCYFTVNRGGSRLRLDLGDKRPAMSPVWEYVSARALKDAEVSRHDFEAGRPACQWPNK